jgi:tetratricopeptide (TPR) repeat protein
VHLIEKGKARPSMPTLELIARRTGQPVSYFLTENPQPSTTDSQRLWVEVETMLAREDFSAVTANLTPLLEANPDPESLARANLLLGITHAKLVEADRALKHLRAAKTHFEATGDRWRLVECLDWEAACLSVNLDPGALALAERALELCRGLNPVPLVLEAQILGHIGRIHVANSNWTLAVEAYKEAVEASSSLRDLGRLARMYNDLGLAYTELGNQAEALVCAQKSLQIHSMLRNERATLMAQNNLGWLLVRQGHYEQAEDHLESAYQRCRELGFDRIDSFLTLSLAELRLRQRRYEEAQDWIDKATGIADDQSQPRRKAKAFLLQAEVAAHQGEDARADAAFDAALSLYLGSGAGEELIACHAAYAQALEDRGDLARSVYHWKQAVGTGRPHLVRPAGGEEEIRLIS